MRNLAQISDLHGKENTRARDERLLSQVESIQATRFYNLHMMVV